MSRGKAQAMDLFGERKPRKPKELDQVSTEDPFNQKAHLKKESEPVGFEFKQKPSAEDTVKETEQMQFFGKEDRKQSAQQSEKSSISRDSGVKKEADGTFQNEWESFGFGTKTTATNGNTWYSFRDDSLDATAASSVDQRPPTQDQEDGGKPEQPVSSSAKSSRKTMLFSRSSKLAGSGDVAKFLLLKSKFEKGRTVLALSERHEPLMLLLQVDKELMAFRYLGSSLEVRIPAYVCDLPVRFIHPEFICGGFSPFSGIKYQSLKGNFKINELADLNLDSLKQSLRGIKKLVLPNTLTMLPPKMFSGCASLRELVVPASVTSVSSRAFAYSCFRHIYFEGECPQGFRQNVLLPRGVKIHFRKGYESSFLEVL